MPIHGQSLAAQSASVPIAVEKVWKSANTLTSLVNPGHEVWVQTDPLLAGGAGLLAYGKESRAVQAT